MFSIEGSHGTCISRAKAIQNQGFQYRSGRVGGGAYFWCQEKYNKLLALAWYKQQLAGKIYKNDDDPLPAIVFADLHCNDSELLDLEKDRDLKFRIDQLADDFSIDKNNKEDLAAVHDLFIECLESEREIKCSILLVKVAMPRGLSKNDYPIVILGAPFCAVVRNLQCIRILRIDGLHKEVTL